MILLAILLVVFGLPMLVGGVWLIALGGSWYYALAGTTLIVIAFLVKPRRTFAQALYALLLAAGSHRCLGLLGSRIRLVALSIAAGGAAAAGHSAAGSQLDGPSTRRYLTRHCLDWSEPVHCGQHSL